MTRFTTGLAKKVLLADYLGETAQLIMSKNFGSINASTAWLGAICYTLQIYFDFSGYSDMAIGLGKVFGFNFCENFNFPYISKSISEFWRRWHISLSSWFRDYLYIPLGGSRKGNVYVNLGIVFLITGIWHGAEWGFLLWGVWHGFFIIVERFAKNKIKIVSTNKFVVGLRNIVAWLYTMLVVNIGWVLFSIVDIQKSIEYVAVMFNIQKYDFITFETIYFLDKRTILILAMAMILCIPINTSNIKVNNSIKTISKYIVVFCLLIMSFIKIVNNDYSPFIYFRF